MQKKIYSFSFRSKNRANCIKKTNELIEKMEEIETIIDYFETKKFSNFPREHFLSTFYFLFF